MEINRLRIVPPSAQRHANTSQHDSRLVRAFACSSPSTISERKDGQLLEYEINGTFFPRGFVPCSRSHADWSSLSGRKKLPLAPLVNHLLAHCEFSCSLVVRASNRHTENHRIDSLLRLGFFYL